MLILFEGKFGAAVSRILRDECGNVETMPLSQYRVAELDRCRPDFVAVALWRPYDRECRALDHACWRAGIPWSSAWLFEGAILCGPLVTPGRGPCFGCFRRRWLTHQRSPERELCLLEAYDREPTLGPEGYCAPMARLAAASLLKDTRDSVTAPGRLIKVDLFGGNVTETRVIGVHGCPVCGSPHAIRGDRLVRRLIPAVRQELA